MPNRPPLPTNRRELTLLGAVWLFAMAFTFGFILTSLWGAA